MPGFPNLFSLAGPNSPLGNIPVIEIPETQARYLPRWFHELECEAIESIQPTLHATAASNDALTDAMQGTIRGPAARAGPWMPMEFPFCGRGRRGASTGS
jgi:hypothetical protein